MDKGCYSLSKASRKLKETGAGSLVNVVKEQISDSLAAEFFA